MRNCRKLTRPLAKATLLALLAISSSGCINLKSYVDPQYHHSSFGDLQRVNPPYELSVRVEFQVNGIDKPGVDPSIQERIERSLRASGVAVPYGGKGQASGELMVVMNNITSKGKAAAKGFGTGLTFGLVGSHVTDSYEIKFRLIDIGGTTELVYQHAIMSTVGNASGPPGITPTSPGIAVDRVIDDVVTNFLKDAQTAGKFPLRTS